jgi:hypothetical protein
MDGDVFDMDLFIDEVEKRPTIWVMASTEYSNKVSKRRAWEEIVLIFSDSGDGDDKKKILGTYTLLIYYLLFQTRTLHLTLIMCISIDVQPTSHSIGNCPRSVKDSLLASWKSVSQLRSMLMHCTFTITHNIPQANSRALQRKSLSPHSLLLHL